MRGRYQLVRVGEMQVVRLRDDLYRHLTIWRTATGMATYPRCTASQQELENLHAQAVAYVGLLGTVDGFPEVELDVSN